MNIMKYAFPDKTQDNKISKHVRKIDNDTAELIVEYNGKDIKNLSSSSNLSCDIIKSLTKQLSGNISLIKQENGTAYKLIFPIEMKHTIEYN